MTSTACHQLPIYNKTLRKVSTKAVGQHWSLRFKCEIIDCQVYSQSMHRKNKLSMNTIMEHLIIARSSTGEATTVDFSSMKPSQRY